MTGELIREALYTLRTNLLRTVLTMIGIVLGVGAVVTIMTMGRSAFMTAQNFMDESGFANISIRRQSFSEDTLPINNLLVGQLKSAQIEGVAGYEPYIMGGGGTAQNSWDDEFIVDYNYVWAEEAQKEDYLAGAPFDEDDVEAKSNVIVIDSNVAAELYESPEAAVGEKLRIGNNSYRIAGVFQATEPFAMDYGMGMVPFSLGELDPFFQTYGYYSIDVKVEPGADYEVVTERIKEALMELYGFENEDELAFRVDNVRAEMAQISMFMTAFSAGLSLIAAISLVVGGVGIMNIMLVSVTERTKEIGLMKALGAQEKDITFQFLVEAVVMTVLGGLVGVTGGILFSWLMIAAANFFGASVLPHFTYVVDFNSIWISLAVSVLIGLVFGAYPAKKAAQLDPVEALRRD